MRRLDFRHPRGRCPVWVGSEIGSSALESLREWALGRTVFVLSAEPVRQAVGDRIEANLLESVLSGASKRVDLTVPDGEDAKRAEIAGQLWSEMLDAGGKRDSGLIAVGGGSIGDLGGFVAGTFMRGIDLVQVPTTLLAQVDASVGGKTAIDRPEAKNSVGVFHYPQSVVVDTGVLRTLPLAELRSGLVEAIKMAALLNHDLLGTIEASLEELLTGDGKVLEPVVTAAIQAKIDVVEDDPEESGFRKVLNFGHTLGHAIEKALEFGVLRHGEAVAYGMLFALRMSSSRGLSPEFSARLQHLVLRLDLPKLPDLDPGVLMGAMARDKKATEGGLTWVLATGGGEPLLTNEITNDEVETTLREFLAAPLAGP